MSLSEIKSEPVQELIESLQGLIEDAKQGELQGIAYVCLADDNRTSFGWNISTVRKKDRISAIIGELDMLKTLLTLNSEDFYGLLVKMRDETSE